jgi:pimeloyl-ACP methyl ester carboxylesterase
MPMTHGASLERISVTVGGVAVELNSAGSGRPFLFLHGLPGLMGNEVFFRRLSERGQVVAPSHPGFGRTELPAYLTTVTDLAFFYADLLDQQKLNDVVVVGSSFGGWVAAELATLQPPQISSLVLLDPVGVKIGGRDDRDIADIYSISAAEFRDRAYHKPDVGKIDIAGLSDEELAIMARNRESGALFCWAPYMHNPKLTGRLGRVRVPTLLMWGASDRIVTPAYGRAYAKLFASASFELIEKAGHFPQIEQPDTAAARLFSFVEAAQCREKVA